MSFQTDPAEGNQRCPFGIIIGINCFKGLHRREEEMKLGLIFFIWSQGEATVWLNQSPTFLRRVLPQN